MDIKGLLMIRVKVELVPFGNEKMKKEIARLIIINNKTGDEEIGNYDFKSYKFQEIFDTNNNKFITVMLTDKEGKFVGFERRKNVWHLIKSVLNSFL